MSEQNPFEGWGAKRQEQSEQSYAAIEAGTIRTEIPCDEARAEWFTMARTMYVANDPEPRFPIDLEMGIHMGGCETNECRQLATAYWTLLRPSHPDNSALLSEAIDNLEAAIIPPTA